MLVVSHTTGGGGGCLELVTSLIILQLPQNIINFIMQNNYGSKRAEQVSTCRKWPGVELREGGLGVAVSASDIIERCPHQIAVFSRSSSWQYQCSSLER